MLAAFALAVVVLLAVLSRVTVRTDMTEFLPSGQTEAARLVMDEARAGTATGLILVAIEGADIGELARISRAMSASLPATGLFRLVAGGEAALPPAALEGLFARRYLLADADFSVAGLRAGMQGLLRQLQSSAAPLVTQFGFLMKRLPSIAARFTSGTTRGLSSSKRPKKSKPGSPSQL